MFETERLIVRRMKPEDWADLYEYESDENVLKYLSTWRATEENCKELAAEWSKDETVFAVCLKDTGKMFGHIDIRPVGNPALSNFEIGYVFSPKYQRMGYATESCRRLIQYGFEELNARRIISMPNVENTASWKLAERLGMRREGHLVQSSYAQVDADNKPILLDEYCYAILRSEWEKPAN